MKRKQTLVNRTTKQYKDDWAEFKKLSREVTGKPGDEYLREVLEKEVKKLRKIRKSMEVCDD